MAKRIARSLDDNDRPDDGDGDGDGDGGDNGDDAILPSTPDVAIQIRGGLSSTAGCLEPEQAEQLRSAVEALLRRRLPGVDVRQACLTTPQGVTATTVGVWRDASNPLSSPARDLGLRRVDIIRPTEAVAVFVAAGFVRSRVQEQFDRMPKRYRGTGTASPDGPIHITRFTLDMKPGGNDLEAQVVLVVHGFDTRPVPDVNFTITYTDVLQCASNAIVSRALPPDLDDDAGIFNVLTTLLSILVTAVVPPAVLFTQDVLSAVLQQPSGTPQAPGVGGSIAREFFPAAVMIPGKQKLQLLFARVNASARGVIGAGSFLPTAREPRCIIVGPQKVTGDFRDPIIVAEFQVVTSELRGELAVAWSGDELKPTTQTLATTIQIRPRIHRKGLFKLALRVKVTDADGMTAIAIRTIDLHLVDELFVPPNTGHLPEPS